MIAAKCQRQFGDNFQHYERQRSFNAFKHFEAINFLSFNSPHARERRSQTTICFIHGRRHRIMMIFRLNNKKVVGRVWKKRGFFVVACVSEF